MVTPRKLSWRDGLATLIVGFAVLLAAAVVNGWNWPVVGSSYRVAGVAVFLVGLAACIAGGESMAARRGDAFMTAGSRLSVLAVLLLLGCLIFGSAPFFLGLTAFTVLMWLLATIHHLAGGMRPSPRQGGAA